MNKILQKIKAFAERCSKEISEPDIIPEYDLNEIKNYNLNNSEFIDNKMIEELKKAENDTNSLYSSSVDPAYNTKTKNENSKKKNIASKTISHINENSEIIQGEQNRVYKMEKNENERYR